MFEFKKREPESLNKADPETTEHLRKLRAVAPDTARFIAQKLFVDSMVPGVGNKAAWLDFQSRPKRGVHVMLDGNDFGLINKKWGQSEGDEAIKSMGMAISRASRKFRGKLFRVGGDEFRAHFEKPEHAHAFLRQLRDEMDALPPVRGQHFHSVSAGLGHDPGQAEQALIHAKDAKKAANYAPGHALMHAHSLLSGSAGRIPVVSRPEIPHGIGKPNEPGDLPMPTPSMHSAEVPGLRKFEEPLEKMALIHDNPGKPVPVWRVQNDQGEGPYNGMDPEILDQAFQQPNVREDFEPHEAARIRPAHRFGFLAPEHAERWFGPEAMSAMRGEGFVLCQVLARKVWSSKSGKQVMFEPHEPPKPAPAPKPQRDDDW